MSPDNLPAGSPSGAADPDTLAPVWCACGVRWTPTPEGYRPDRVDATHPDIPCRPVSAIPCGPVTPWDPSDYPNSGPAAVEQATREVMEGDQ